MASRVFIRGLGGVASLLFGMSIANAQARLIGLGDLPGGTYESRAYGVSADGSVVVGYSVSAAGYQAFRWTAASGMVGLGDLPGGRFDGRATGISGDGSVIVGGSASDAGDQAVRWANGGVFDLGDLAPGLFWGIAQGVSDDGSVIVGSGRSALGTEAFRWTSGGGMVGLGFLPGGETSYAEAANIDGSVIVGASTTDEGQQPFRWSAESGMVGLGNLPGGGLYTMYAFDVSADGSVVVGYGESAANAEAFRWTAGTGLVRMGRPPGSTFSVARGISGDGSKIVGGYDAFLWTPQDGMQTLWNVLVANGVDPAANGWRRLISADDISQDGTTIVGTGNRNGNFEAFVAVISKDLWRLGDLNCDGIVTTGDIAGFVLALTNPVEYIDQYPACDPNNADATGNGVVNVADIGPFVRLLTD